MRILLFFFICMERTGCHCAWAWGPAEGGLINYLWITPCRAMHVDGLVFRKIVVPAIGEPQVVGVGLYPC